LNNDDNKIIKDILRIYNTLHYPLRSIDKVKETGHSTSNRRTKPIEDIEEIKPVKDPMESLKQKYNTYRRARWDVLKLEDEILVQTKGGGSKEPPP